MAAHHRGFIYHCGGVVSWSYQKYEQYEQQRQRLAQDNRDKDDSLLQAYLVPIQLHLEATRSDYDHLAEVDLEPGWGLLESFVRKGQREGPAVYDNHPLMFEMMSDLVDRDAKMVQLVEGYAPYALTDEYKKQSAMFLSHTRMYQLRFKVLPKLISTKQQLTKGEEFPKEFPAAIGVPASFCGTFTQSLQPLKCSFAQDFECYSLKKVLR
jgi:hypothetical protein